MSIVVLLGAGASRGTLEEAPVAAEFGRCLNRQVPDWDETYPYLAAVVGFLERRIPNTSKESWALDKVWGAIDNRVKLKYILDLNLPGAPSSPPRTKRNYDVQPDPWGLAGFELRCAVTRIYGARLNSAIQEAVKGSGTLKEELARLQAGDCLISFNYDLLAEELLRAVSKRVVRSGRLLETGDIEDAVLLCKPHGCLSWKQRVPENGRVVQILEHPMAEKDVDFDPRENATIQPVIVAPVPFKSEIIVPELQEGNVDDSFKLLVSQWRDAIQRISQAEKLIVLGYGFPPEDLHAQYLFGEAAAKRESNKRLKIEIYEICRQRYKEVKEAINRLLKPALCKYHCEYKGPVEP
jgi:hypothetical protein